MRCNIGGSRANPQDTLDTDHSHCVKNYNRLCKEINLFLKFTSIQPNTKVNSGWSRVNIGRELAFRWQRTVAACCVSLARIGLTGECFWCILVSAEGGRRVARPRRLDSDWAGAAPRGAHTARLRPPSPSRYNINTCFAKSDFDLSAPKSRKFAASALANDRGAH